MKAFVVRSINVVDYKIATRELLEKIKEKVEFRKYSLGLFFCASTINGENILKGIYKEVEIPIIGCSSSGEISGEGYSNDSIVLMILTSDKDIFKTGIIEKIESKTIEEIEKEIKSGYKMAKDSYGDKKPSTMLLFPDFGGVKSANKIFKMINKNYKELMLFGGGASIDYGDESQQFLEYYNEKSYRDAMPYAYIKTENKPIIAYENISNISLESVGNITKYRENIIEEIDGKPAYNFLKECLDYDVKKESIFLLYPLIIIRDNYKYARIIIDIDKEKGHLILGGTIPYGGKIAVQAVTSEFIKDSTNKTIDEALKKVKKENSLAICISCECRKLINIFDKNEETDIIRKKIENKLELVGFYSHGEITPLINDKNEMYNFYNNETIAICIL